MLGKRLFVTVGTTKFEKLVATVQSKDVLDKLDELSYKTVQFQTGAGRFEEKTHPAIKLRYCPYFEHFHKEIQKSDLVISHAGAGTCIDVLRCRKPLIVVVNEDLMDNHQIELAEQLQRDGYLFYCTCDTLLKTLEQDLSVLKEFPPAEKELFGRYVDKCMGFD